MEQQIFTNQAQLTRDDRGISIHDDFIQHNIKVQMKCFFYSRI